MIWLFNPNNYTKPKRWAPEEKQFLKDSFSKLSDSDIGRQLGRERGSIRAERSRLKLVYRNRTRWSSDELDFVRENFVTMSYAEMALHTGRSTNAVIRFIQSILKPKGRKRRVFRKKKCSLCGKEYQPTQGHQLFCGTCKALDNFMVIQRERWRQRKLKNALTTWVNGQQVYYTNLNKIDYPEDDRCQLCGCDHQKRVLAYHHWDDANPSDGIWVCEKCHRLCEALDLPLFEELSQKYGNWKANVAEHRNGIWRFVKSELQSV